MCGLIALFTALIFGIAGWLGMVTPVQVEPPVIVVTPEMPQPIFCEPSDPQADRQIMIDLGLAIFEPDVWSTNIREIVASKTIGQWDSTQLGAVAFAELLHYDCGVQPDVVDEYFSDENIAIILANYDSWEQIDYCERGDVRLWMFRLTFNNTQYEQRMWVEQISPTRVLSVSLTFPETPTEQMNRYAARLRPDFTVCGG